MALQEMGMTNFITDDDDDTSSNSYEEYEHVRPRRPYTLRTHAVVDDWDDVAFHQRFRLKNTTFRRVVAMVEPNMATEPGRCRSLTTEQRVLILLRFLAAGSFEQNAVHLVRVSQLTVSLNLRCVAQLFYRIYSDATDTVGATSGSTRISFSRWFSADYRSNRLHSHQNIIARGFAGRNVPQSIGSIDCTHIRILSPGGLQAETFRNRKDYFSLNVQTVSSAEMVCFFELRSIFINSHFSS